MKIKFFTKSHSSNVVMVLGMILLLIVCFMHVYPLVWMVYTSLKDPVEYISDTFGLPTVYMWKNYAKIFTMLKVDILVQGQGWITYDIYRMFMNSIILAAFSPIAGILSQAVMGYVISKYKFRGRDLLQKINIIVMIIPIVGALPSSLALNRAIGRYDNLLFMLTFGAQPFGFGMLLYYNAFKSISWSYSEAAMIDGAGHFTVMSKIMLPMIFPTLVVWYVLGFMTSWNDYMVPLIWLPHMPNLSLGMYQFQYDAQKYGATVPETLAGFVIVSIPSAVLYLSCQKAITSKMVVGGLKG